MSKAISFEAHVAYFADRFSEAAWRSPEAGAVELIHYAAGRSIEEGVPLARVSFDRAVGEITSKRAGGDVRGKAILSEAEQAAVKMARDTLYPELPVLKRP